MIATWAALGVGIARSQSVWVTDFNGDASQPPQGYRYNEGIWGQDALIDVAYDPVGTTLDLQVSFNGGPYNVGFSPSWDDYSGTGFLSATLPYTCGKVTARVTRYYKVGTVPYHIYTSATEVFVYQGSNLACLPRRNHCDAQSGGQAVGKPCDVVDGRLWYQATDAALSGPFGMTFNRWYDNQSTTLFNADLGAGWRHAYSANLTFPGGGLIAFYSPEGLRTDFNGLGAGGSVHDMLTGADLSENAGGTTYTLTTWEGVKFTFDSSGRLASVTDRIGNVHTITRDGSNRIATVTDPLGRTLTFAAYDASNRVTSITSSPSGVALAFTYDSPCGSGNLCSATMPDGKTWTYQYDGAHNLTQVTDPLGHAEETNTYSGNKLATQSTEGGQSSLTFTYGANTTSVTDGLSRQTVYTFDPKLRVVTDILGVGCGCGGGQQRTFSYDQFLRTQWEMIGSDTNHRVTWAYGRDQTVNHGGFTELVAAYPSPTSKTEHLSSGIDRTTAWSYYGTSDARRDLVNVETRPSVDTPGNSRTTTLTYSTNGLLSSRAEQGYIGGVSTTYTTSYTYDAGGKGRIASVYRGGHEGFADVTIYAYFSDSDSDLGRRGQLQTVTDAAGNVTTYAGATAPYNTYDLFGNPFSVADPNSVVTTMAHDLRGRLTTRTLKGVTGDATDLVTSYQYDDAGRLTKVSLPVANGTSYAYDGSNRLTDTVRFGSDAKQYERVHLVYDVMSEKIEEDNDACTTPATSCSAWSTKRKENFSYDTYGRLSTITHPGGTSITYGYDVYGNLASVQDERHSAPNTTYGYDYANRLTSVVQTLAGAPGNQITTGYAYDLHDNLTSVTDPNTNQTTYAWDDFRRMKSQTSPVSGATTYQYDPAGNLISSTDANTATTTRTYDALNRVLTASSARSGYATENVTYAYDDPNPDYFGKGRLAKMTDPSGSTSYKYDRHGLLRREEKFVGTTPYVTSSTYDANGNRASMTYPSGRLVNFTYDAADRPISEATATTTYVSATGTAYQPFGPISGIGLGNGTTWSMGFNQRYLPTALAMSGTTEGVSYTYSTDAAGNITAITDTVDGSYSRGTFGYDDLNRLTTAPSGSSLWGATGNHVYDAMGNITSMTLGSTGRTFAYSGTTPKLVSVTEPVPIGTRSVSYDSAGNETAIASAGYTYSPRNLLASGDGLAYTYDGRGVRTSETQSGMTITSLSPSFVQVQPSGGSTVITITINGSGLTTSSTASFNGVAKTTRYVASTQLQMDITYNDITAANIDPVTVTDTNPALPPVSAPLVVYFIDVDPSSSWDIASMYLMAYHGITAGCGGGNYCPLSNVTRAEMAVFMLVAEHGTSYSPPACTAPIFNDVPCSYWAAAWINQFYNEGIGAGCSSNPPLYCPDDPLTRDAMALFLLATRERDGSGYTYAPPACTWPMFGDVPCSDPYSAWIDELARRRIYVGCGGGNYCPASPVTRGQMATFISKTWNYRTPTITATRRNFIYDQAMRLIAESSLTSAFEPSIAYEHLWLGDRPVAEEDVSGTQTFWTITDHLGTPFMETFAARTTAWRIEYEPYGWVYSLRSGSDRHQPLRFPGQEAEQLNQGNNGATEKRYNIFRWYHPKWGRYSQADPIGLGDGVHLYSYVDARPIGTADPLGLFNVKACGSRWITFFGGVNHIPIVGGALDKLAGNNLAGFCATCPSSTDSPKNAHLTPPPPVNGGVPDLSLLPAGAQVPGMDSIERQCGRCDGPNQQLFVANVKTRLAITPGGLDKQRNAYSLEYDCKCRN